MAVIEDLYDILHIDRTADNREIKKAYIKMLRKYPPEKAPEEFKKIRKAYERLIDPISRSEYDAFSQYKDEIDEHDKVGSEALKNGDFKIAIKEYKKILIIEPNLSFAKNSLGLALAYDKQYDAALVQFQELIKVNPNNATFYSNLAYVYKGKLDYDEAEKAWLKAYDIDPINDDTILELSRLYVDKEEYDKAIAFLKNSIGKNKDDDFQDFIYYFEMVQVYIFAQNTDGVEKIIDEIEKIIPDEKEAKEYVAWKFGKLAYELYELKVYSLSERISKRALEIDADNDAIKQLYINSKKCRKAFDLYKVLSKDERIIEPLKGPIFYYLYSDEYKEDELKENCDKNILAIQSYIDEDFVNVIKSVDILKSEYSMLYDYKRELYEDIYRISQGNQRHDNSNADGSNYNSSEQVHSENCKKVIIFCENCGQKLRIPVESGRLIVTCPKCHKEFNYRASDFNTESDYKSNTTRSTSNVNSNNSSRQTHNSNSSNGGCGTILICAIIGGAIGHVPGFIIGAFIGLYISSKT